MATTTTTKAKAGKPRLPSRPRIAKVAKATTNKTPIRMAHEVEKRLPWVGNTVPLDLIFKFNLRNPDAKEAKKYGAGADQPRLRIFNNAYLMDIEYPSHKDIEGYKLSQLSVYESKIEADEGECYQSTTYVVWEDGSTMELSEETWEECEARFKALAAVKGAVKTKIVVECDMA